MVMGTYANLYATEEAVSGPERNLVPLKKNDSPSLPKIIGKVEIKDETLQKIKDVEELAGLPELKPNVGIIDPQPSKETTIQKKNPNVIEAPKPVETIVVKEIKKEPPVPEEPKERKEIQIDIPDIPASQKTRVVQDSKIEPPVPMEPSEVLKISETSKTVMNKKEDIIAPIVNNNEIKKPIQIKSKPELTNNNEIPIDKAKEKEIIIEKIKEHEEAQRKLNEEGEKLLEEIKDFVNISKDSLKLVNVKTGVVTDIKASKYQRNELEDTVKKNNTVKEIANLDQERSGLGMKMAKGIPLPLAVKGQLVTGNKVKDVQKTKENEVIDKHDTGRDLLGGEKEIREKRDLEDVIKEGYTEATGNNLILINQNSTKQLNLSVVEKPKDESTLKQNYISNKETISKLKDELESCIKNDSSIVQPIEDEIIVNKNKVDKLLANEKKGEELHTNENKVDELIKSPSYLSNSNPVLDTSPQLLSAEVSKDELSEMPKKRDLKSISNEEITDSKHNN